MTKTPYEALREAIAETMARIHEIATAGKEQEEAPVRVDLRPVVIEALTDAIGGDAYDCTRVWSAWSVGTMSNDDFVQVVDRVEEIADAVLAAIVEPIAKVMGDAAVAEHEAAVATGAQRRALREKIAALIEEVMVESTVDYPAGRDAGHRVEWEEDRLLDGIMAAIGEPPATPSVSVESEEKCIACGVPFRAGDAYYPDASGGEIHAECAGTDREGYTNADGDPLGPNDAIPTPLTWEDVPNPSPAAKSGEAEALRTNIEAFLDMHRKGVLVPPTPGIPIELLAKALAALATPSPQPVDAVREALRKIADEATKANDVIRLNRDGGGQGRVKVATAMHRIAEWSRAALTEPAPAGEAVEPVAWRVRRHGNVGWVLVSSLDRYPEKSHEIEPLFAHPAPEDTARLREDLEQAEETRSTDCVVDLIHAVMKLSEEEKLWFRRSTPIEMRSELCAVFTGPIPDSTASLLEAVERRDYWKETADRRTVERDDARKALIETRTWHEAQDKALSKSGRGDAGYYWSRAQHHEQIAQINAALKVDDGRDAEEAGAGASGDGEVPANIGS